MKTAAAKARKKRMERRRRRRRALERLEARRAARVGVWFPPEGGVDPVEQEILELQRELLKDVE